MKRIFPFLILIILCFGLCFQANAVSSVTDMQCFATVSPDGSCQITTNLTIHLEQVDANLIFPLPDQVVSASVNGSSAHIYDGASGKYVSISKTTGNLAGTFSMSVHYTLDNVLSLGKNDLLLATVPVLSGFAYPVSYMEFSVVFPGEITGEPNFSSLYQQADTDSILSYSVDGNTLNAVVLKELKDHDTFEMRLIVPQEQFSGSSVFQVKGGWLKVSMTAIVLMALLYWALFLRFLPAWPERRTQAPSNITAGDVGTLICNRGTDLTMTVLSWAQMGYLLIEIDARGRVLLKKRMDMGNERSSYENKLFTALFRRKDVVVGNSRSFAILSKKAAASHAAAKPFRHRSLGDPAVFSWFCALFGFFAAINLADMMGGIGFSRVFTTFLWCVLGFFTARGLQHLSGLLFIRAADSKLLGLASLLFWLYLGKQTGSYQLPLTVIGVELAAGILGYYGGRKNTAGRQMTAELLGLRHYLRTLYRNPGNPEAFYSLLPFAFALNMEESLARAYERIPQCTFLIYDGSISQNAAAFVKKMREVVSALNERKRWLFIERLIGK